MSNDKLWWTEWSSIRRFVTAQKKKRSGTRKPRKQRSPTKQAKSLAEKHGVSTRGSTLEILRRVTRWLYTMIATYRKVYDVSLCLPHKHHKIECRTCALFEDCGKIVMDLRRVRRLAVLVSARQWTADDVKYEKTLEDSDAKIH